MSRNFDVRESPPRCTEDDVEFKNHGRSNHFEGLPEEISGKKCLGPSGGRRKDVPSRPLSTSKLSKHSSKSLHASSLSSNVSRGDPKIAVEDIIPGRKNFDSSFKIPKKNLKVVGTISSGLHAGDEGLYVCKKDNNTNPPVEDRKAVHIIEKDSSDYQQYEDMDWETTVQEIKGLWPGAHFDKSYEFSGIGRFTKSGLSVDIEMDVDSEPSDSLIIVPDTNIWIRCLPLIRELLSTKFHRYSQPVVVIPWMVLQELDIHGKHPRGSSRTAIHFIHQNLCANNPKIKGQKASDAIVTDPSYNRLNADDSILQCALQCQNEHTTVVLLTNDVNLKNKAIVNSVLAADSFDGVNSLRDTLLRKCANSSHNFVSSLSPASVVPSIKIQDLVKNRQYISPTPRTSSTTNTVSASTPKNTGESPANTRPAKRYHSPRLSSSETKMQKLISSKTSAISFGDALDLIQQTLSHIVTSKMKEDYGDPDWLNVVKIRPPWTAKSVVQCIIKHYVAVFTEVFGRKVSSAEKLLSLISQYKAGNFINSKSQIFEEDIIECVLGMFAAGEFAMDDIIRKDPIVATCRQTLLEFRSRSKTNKE
ncbi:unnamed protein product [Allacma fusca]|uniref:PIN domain-containing protein n=1 Tax=Allacma fusca TaxID=39272 RepID=A0A8J2KQR2_9HEXA|nr:unnamed protein product [Allacma fusca]